MKTKLMFIWLLTVLILVKAAAAYTIVGDSVVEEDANVYLSATPHTLDGSGWVVFNITSKTFTGDVNVMFGVDTEQMNPTRVFRWSDAQQKWINFQKAWSSAYHNLDGKNKWFFIENVPVVAGQDYRLAIYLELTHNATGKYDFGMHPSSYGFDVISSYQAGHLYYIDPWFNSSWLFCREWNITENDAIQRNNMVVQHNLTGLTLLNNATEIRIINGTCLDGGNEIEYSLVKTDDATWATVQYWVNISASDTIQYSVYYGASSVPNPLPYDSPPIMFEVDFPDGTNTTNRTAPYIFNTGASYVATSDKFSGTGSTASTIVQWYLHENFLYYANGDSASFSQINAQIGHRMNVGAWRSYAGYFIGGIGTTDIINIRDGWFGAPLHYLATSYNLVEYSNGVAGTSYLVDRGTDTLNFIHTNHTWLSNGTNIMSTNTSSFIQANDATPPTALFNGTQILARSSYADVHWMKFSTGSLYGVELSAAVLTLSGLSPEITQGTEWYPTVLNISMVETTSVFRQGWLSDNATGTNVTYNLSMSLNDSCFDYSVSPVQFQINGTGNQTINWSIRQYRNCSVGTYSGTTRIYYNGEFLDEIPINLNVTNDNNTHTPINFTMTINQGNLDTSYFNASNSNNNTNSTFTFTDNFDVFCFSKTYLPSTFDLDGIETEQWGFRIGVNPLCPNITYYGSVSVYDDGFFDFTIPGRIIVTNITTPPSNISSAGMNCTYSSEPYLRRTIDWVCLLNTTSDWYCYGSVFWNNNPTDLVSISPDSAEVEDYGILDYQLVSGRILNMQFKNTDLYDNNLYNFTVECVSALTNQTASFSTLITPTFAEPRSLIYRSVWLKDNATFLIIIVALSLLVVLAIGLIVRKVKGR